MLDHRVPPARAPTWPVAGGDLVGVLAVAQVLDPLEPEVQRRRQQRLGVLAVRRRPLRRATRRSRRRRPRCGRTPRSPAGGGWPPTAGRPGAARRAPARSRRVDDDADVGVVLGRRPHHRRPADVDQVDARVAGERVEVDDDQRDRRDVVVLEVAAVVGVVRVGEDPAVHLRVQRHDAVAEDGRQPGDLGDVGHRDAGLGDHPRRTAAGQERPAELVEATGEVGDPGLVVHGEQRGGHPRRVRTSASSARSRHATPAREYVDRRAGRTSRTTGSRIRTGHAREIERGARGLRARQLAQGGRRHGVLRRGPAAVVAAGGLRRTARHDQRVHL